MWTSVYTLAQAQQMLDADQLEEINVTEKIMQNSEEDQTKKKKKWNEGCNFKQNAQKRAH